MTRDPRVDPRKGDVVRDVDGDELTVLAVWRDDGDDGDIIQVDYLINGCECHCCFYEWHEQCCHEVVTVAGEVE